jgi:outer membrane biogenesis lipoprotein LolB
MKSLKFIAVIVAIVALSACSTTKETAPTNVQDAFTQKFPDAKSVKWEKENDTEWEAEFKLNGEEYSANFATDGNWKETEHEIKMADIPAAVKATLDSQFSEYKVEEAEIAETAEGSVYEFELKKGKEEIGLNLSKVTNF